MWTVIVEAEGDLREPALDRALLEQLLGELGDGRVAVGYSPHRYSAQFSVEGADPAEATSRALGFWREATRRTGLPSWPVVRIQAQARPTAA